MGDGSDQVAKPSSSHLPTTSAASPFCHICQTNQTLIMNMLANYLPDEQVSPHPTYLSRPHVHQLLIELIYQDPTYRILYNELPNYLEGVHTRYPPVCENCQPAVDEALRKANHRANVDAWGSALRRNHQSIEGGRSGWMEMLDVGFWRLRGILFCSSTIINTSLGVIGMSFISDYDYHHLGMDQS